MTWFIVVCVVVVVVVCGLAALSNRAAYRNGFWDGVLWERERGGRVFPDSSDHRCINSCCVICADRTPGWESLYPSKPDPSWSGWKNLMAGMRQRTTESQSDQDVSNES